jgi:hypothetical protein
MTRMRWFAASLLLILAGSGVIHAIRAQAPFDTHHTQGNGMTCNTCTITFASGTAVLGTSAIASGACASAVTIAAPNVSNFIGWSVASGGTSYLLGDVLTVVQVDRRIAVARWASTGMLSEIHSATQ